MFVPGPTPEESTLCELRALRLSLNSPVVSLASLPVGPAAAAIALHSAAGRAQVTIVVRAERGGERVFYAEAEPSQAPQDPDLLLDAGLSFAESMGFLFDDDEVEARGGAGSREAVRIWREFAGLGESPGAGRSAQTGAIAADELDPAGSGGELATLPLTKFRQRIAKSGMSREGARARIGLLGRF